MIPLFDLLCTGCGHPYPAAPGAGSDPGAARGEDLPAACPRCGGFWAYGDRLAWRPPAPLPGLRAWAQLFGVEPGELTERELSRPLQRLDRPFPATVWQQGSAPEGSFKERGAELLATACVRRRLDEVFLDSSGNAGIAMARATAARGIACRVLVPETTPRSKIDRLRDLGAHVEEVPGDRRAAHEAARRLAARHTYASHIVQPFFHAGVATLAWDLSREWIGGEAAEPGIERLLLPVGNGSLLLGLELGFDRLVRAGRRARPPALHAVQLAGFASLERGGPGTPAEGPPRAAGIAIADPPRRREMASALERTGGDVTVVSDGEIARAREELAAEGFPTDPTGATAWAGLRRRPDLAGEGTVVILTSNES